MRRPSHYRDKDGVEWGSSQRFVEAANFALRSLAEFLGREDEYEAFVKLRKTAILTWNDDPNAPKVEYEEYAKGIPYWVKVMEEPLFKMYQAGLDDGRSTTGHKSKKERRERISISLNYPSLYLILVILFNL